MPKLTFLSKLEVRVVTVQPVEHVINNDLINIFQPA